MLTIERDDWSAVAEREFERDDRAGRPASADVPTTDGGEHARREVAGLCADAGAEWTPRRQVWAVEELRDGRVVAALEGTALECWRPSGRRAWSVPHTIGGRQVHVLPDQGTAWVNTPGRRLGEPESVEPPSAVRRIRLSDGAELGTVETGDPVGVAARGDGWLVLPGCRRDADAHETLLVSPAGRVSAYSDPEKFSAGFRFLSARGGPEALIVRSGAVGTHSESAAHNEAGSSDGAGTLGGAGVHSGADTLGRDGRNRRSGASGRKWIVAVDPGDGTGAPTYRPLLALDRGAGAAGYVFNSLAVTLSDVHGAALVQSGSVVTRSGLASDGVFVVRRDLPGGDVRWEFTTGSPATALDAEGATVYVAFVSGEVVALDAGTGDVRWRRRVVIDGHAAEPLALAAPAPGRLLIGTGDGRIVECAT